MIVLYIILAIVALAILCTTQEPREFGELRQRYNKFVSVVPDEFQALKKKSILLCLTGKGEPGYNVNKGYEIAICNDPDVNAMFHVLLHELAHCTVTEYKHSQKFWENLKKLKNIATRHELYTPISEPTNFCGKTRVSD